MNSQIYFETFTIITRFCNWFPRDYSDNAVLKLANN